jgi:exopolysaccharide biosynthesis operon protein EpsL
MHVPAGAHDPIQTPSQQPSEPRHFKLRDACHTTSACIKSRPGSTPPAINALACRWLTGAVIAMASAATPAWSQVAASNGSSNGTAEYPFLKDLTLVAGGGVTSDSNLFRRPTAQSETISNGYIGLRLDKSHGQQQVQLDVTQTVTRYGKFKYLDFDSLSYSGAWNWRLGKHFSGKLSASRNESLSPFEDTAAGIGRNVRISQNQAFDLDNWITDGWHLLLGVSQSDQKSEQNLQSRTPDFKSVNASAGIRYQTRAGNSLTLRRQSTDGEYINAPVGASQSDYTENLNEISADWKLSAASSLNGRLGWLDRDNKDPARRDFSGKSSSLSYNWNPGGKLALAVSVSSRASPLQDLTASHRQDETLAVSPSWQISEKTSAFLRLSQQKSTDQGVLVALPGGPRRDTTNTSAAGLDWAVSRKLSVNISLERQERRSNNAISNFEATIGRIGATLAF